MLNRENSRAAPESFSMFKHAAQRGVLLTWTQQGLMKEEGQAELLSREHERFDLDRSQLWRET
jgi:hypothetical protein